MADKKYRLQIEIDGRQAAGEAGKLRQAIESEISKIAVIQFDSASLKRALEGIGGIDISGAVSISGLEAASAELTAMRQAAEAPLLVSGTVQVAGLRDAAELLAGMKTDARSLGRALSSGLEERWAQAREQLVGLQQEITGAVQAGAKTNIAEEMLGDLPELEAALADGDKKALNLTMKLKETQVEIDELNRRIAELGTTKVAPLAGGLMHPVSELYEGLMNPGKKGAITRVVNQIDKETADLRAALKRAEESTKKGMGEQVAALRAAAQEADRAYDEFAESEDRPFIGSTGPQTEEARAWVAQLSALAAARTQAYDRLTEAESQGRFGMNEEAQKLRSEIQKRQTELEATLAGDKDFWREWTMESVSHVIDALRSDAQKEAAAALEEMVGLGEKRAAAMSKLRQTAAGLQKGGEVELPKGAKGTMVDYITAERALGKAAGDTTGVLMKQRQEVQKLIKAMQDAAAAMQGATGVERAAYKRLEEVAASEIQRGTSKKMGVEEAAEIERDVLQRLSVEIAKTQEQIKASLSGDVTSGQVAQANKLVALWTKIKDILVGHSIIPDMVRDINEWLSKIGVAGLPFSEFVDDAKTSADQVVMAFMDMAKRLPTEQIEARIESLTQEMAALEHEANQVLALNMRGVGASSEVSAKRAAWWDEAQKNVLRQYGDTDFVRGMLAQGKLPKGYGFAGETRWDKGLTGKAGEREERGREVTDVWYQALAGSEVDVLKRFSAEDNARLDAIQRQLQQKQAQLAALVVAQVESEAEALQRSIKAFSASGAQAELAEAEAQMEGVGVQMTAAYDEAGDALEKLGETVQQEREKIGRRALSKGGAAGSSLLAKDTAQAQKLAGELGLSWEEVEQQIRDSGESVAAMVGKLQAMKVAQKAATVEAQAMEKAQAKARQMAGELGGQWVRKVEEAVAAGQTVDVLVGKMERSLAKRQAKEKGKTQVAAQVAKDTAQAQKLAGELGLSWEEVEQQIKESGESVAAMVGKLEAMKAAQKESTVQAKAQAKAQAEARKLAGELGGEWAGVVDAEVAAGRPLDGIIGQMKRASAEARSVKKATQDTGQAYGGLLSRVKLFANELNKARTQQFGTAELIRDVGDVGRTLQMWGTGLTGSIVLAGRSYLELAEQSDQASRSLLLSREMADSLTDSVMEMSADMGLLDPQQIASGTTIWAQATGQAVEAQADLLRIMEQTIPIQALAVLSSTDVATVTDGTAAAIRQYGLQLDEADYVTALFNKVADDTLASVGDIAEAFKMVGPQAHSMGETIESTAALMGIMADQNVRGSTAGRAYRQMLLSLTDTTDKSKAILQQTFGTESPFHDAQGQFVGMATVVDMLAAATAEMTDEEKELVIATMFTANAVPGITALIEAQTDGRERGINVMRAEEKLLRGVIDEEVLAYAQLKKETDNTSIAMMGAVDLWERQISDFTESDVAKIKQLENRWSVFWMKVGEDALDFALPALTKASDVLAQITDMIEDQPAIGGLAAVGLGAISLGTLLSAISGTARAIQTGRLVIDAAQKAFGAQEVAGQKFGMDVQAAGAEFKATVVAAAQEAAGIEKTGAVEESQIEKASAVEEGQIEKAAAAEAATTTKAGAGGFAGALFKAIMAYEVADLAARSMGQEGALGFFSTKEGQTAGAARVAELGGQDVGVLRGELTQVQTDLQILRSFGGLLAPEYWKTAVFGIDDAGQRLNELFGGSWWMKTSTTAIADKIAELEAVESGVIDALAVKSGGVAGAADVWMDAMGGMDRAAGRASDGIYDLTGALEGVTELTESEVKTAEAYIDMLEAQADATSEFEDRMRDLESSLHADLADMARNYKKSRKDEEASFYRDQAAAEADFRKEQAERAREHAEALEDLEEEHEYRMTDLIAARDAAGVYEEQRQYARDVAEEQENYEEEKAQAAVEFAEEQAQRAVDHAAKMEELRVQYEEEKAQRLAQFASDQAQAQAEHAAEMARLEQEYFDKINSEAGYFKLSQEQQKTYQTAMLADARSWLSSKRQVWLDYVRNLPTPGSYGSTAGPAKKPTFSNYAGAYQAGGYVRETGGALVHAGEFVLNPQTVAQLEAHMGPLSQGRVLAGVGAGAVNVQIHATFGSGISAADRGWINDALAQTRQAAVREVLQGLGG